MAAQGSLKPLVFVRSEYRQLCYISSLEWQLTILDERDIDIYDDNAPQASKKAANFAKWLLMSRQIGK